MRFTRTTGVAGAVVLLAISLIGFQNCSGAGSAPAPASAAAVQAAPTPAPLQMSASNITLNIGQTATVSVLLTSITRSDAINWNLPNGSPFSPTSGFFDISAGQPGAVFSITSMATPGTGNQTYDLALNDQANLLTPITITVTVLDPTPPDSMSASYMSTCATVNGVPKCWGYNGYGQLGNGLTTEANSPVATSVLPVDKVQQIAMGENTACAISSGTLYCWGNNNWGQLGQGTTSNVQADYIPQIVVGMETNVSAVSIGGNSVCAIQNSALYCWGYNGYGELGAGIADTYVSGATPVVGMSSGVTAISAGLYHACAIQNGAVKCWGYNGNGQLGNGTNDQQSSPVSVIGAASGTTNLALGSYHSCAVVSGVARCWGINSNYEMGNGGSTDQWVAAPVPGVPSGVTQVAAGLYHSCALSNGGVMCWGYNGNGQIGNGTYTSSSTPVQVSGLTSGVSVLTSGTDAQHTCAIVNNQPQCWGYNGYGQLGTGTTTGTDVPTPVSF